MLIDSTHLFSYSQNIEFARAGYNNQHEFEPQFDLLF